MQATTDKLVTMLYLELCCDLRNEKITAARINPYLYISMKAFVSDRFCFFRFRYLILISDVLLRKYFSLSEEIFLKDFK